MLESDEGPESNDASIFGAEVVFKGIAGVAGYAIGGPSGAVIGAIGGDVFARALHLDQQQLQRRVHRIERTVTRGAEEASMGWGEFDERLQSDPIRAELYARVLDVAGGALAAEKVDALGRVLASAVVDNTKVDLAFVLSAALRDMEQPHIKALAIINSGFAGEWFDLPDWWAHGPFGEGGNGSGPPALPRWAPHWMVDAGEFQWMATECGGEEVFPVVFRTLQQHALIETQQVGSSGSWKGAHEIWVTTQLGFRLLNFLYPEAPAWVEVADVARRVQEWLDADDGNNMLEWNFQKRRWERWEAALDDRMSQLHTPASTSEG